jgi:hypothetical protein
LADFGQSRLSHEQVPALGTLFYMAPEQADMEAVPDARWDVYALGAVLYCMLTGSPPHRGLPGTEKLDQTADLTKRLAHYRRLLRRAPPLRVDRRVPGIDSDLAEIVERCLAVNPDKRYPNVQSVLDAVEARETKIARRPMMLFGTIGPLLLLLVVLGVTWWGSSGLMSMSEAELLDRAVRSTDYAAEFGGRGLEVALERRFNAVETLAQSSRIRAALAEMERDPAVREMLTELADPDTPAEQIERLRAEFIADRRRRPVQETLEHLRRYPRLPESSGWFVNDARGVQVARYPEEPGKNTLGKCFAWRTYFHGGQRDEDPTWRPAPGENLDHTNISAFFRSQATGRWMVTLSAPVFDEDSPGRPFLGTIGLMVDANEFEELKRTREAPRESGEVPQQFYAIVDWREGDNKGQIVQHDLYDRLIREHGRLPPRLLGDPVAAEHNNGPPVFTLDELPDDDDARVDYRDPLARDREGGDYSGRWLASTWHVVLNRKKPDSRTETGLVVITQTNYETAIGATLERLRNGLLVFGLLATGAMLAVVVALWALAVRLMNSSGRGRAAPAGGDPATTRPSSSVTPSGSLPTAQPHDSVAATEPLHPQGKLPGQSDASNSSESSDK